MVRPLAPNLFRTFISVTHHLSPTPIPPPPLQPVHKPLVRESSMAHASSYSVQPPARDTLSSRDDNYRDEGIKSHSSSSHGNAPSSAASEESESDADARAIPHKHKARNAKATSSSRPSKTVRVALDDSSDGEVKPRGRPKGKKKARPAHNMPSPSPVAGDEVTHSAARNRAPCFNWSKGEGAKARAYLETRYDDWSTCSDPATRVAIRQEAEEHVVREYSFTRHTSGDVRKVGFKCQHLGIHPDKIM